MKFLEKIISKELNADTHEELRRIQTLLLQNEKLKIIHFISSVESKSIYKTAFELFECFNFIEKKAILVNFNLRREDLFIEYFDNQKFIGLEEYLVHDINLNCLIISINKHIDLITCKKNISNSTDFLSDLKLSVLFKNLKNKYEYIFIVTPSLHICYDALILAKYSDGMLYIKEDRLPSKSLLAKHASLLTQIDKPILGMIIVNIDQ